MPQISVIIPVYNVEKYLKQCLDSVIHQTYKDLEILCINDESTDGSLSILKEYQALDKRIRIINIKHGGLGVVRNLGIKEAKGKYFIILDSDDFFELEMLEQMYNQIILDDSDVVICEFYYFDDTLQKVTKRLQIQQNQKNKVKTPFCPEEFADNLFSFCFPNTWTKLYKKEIFDKYNLEFDLNMCCNDFSCVCPSLTVVKKISIINKPFVYYRFNRRNNLTMLSKDHLRCILDACVDFKTNLIKLGTYEKYKKTFEERIRQLLKYESRLCSPQQIQLRKTIANEILPDDLYYILYRKRKKTITKKAKKKYF